MKIAFAGSPGNAADVLKHLAANHEIAGVLTKLDAPTGRKQVMTASAVATVAEALNLPLRKTNQPTEKDIEWLISAGAELCVVVAYGALLRPNVLELGIKFINLHFSLLPKYRGAGPVQAAIMNGESETGVTIFEIDKGLDTGPIIAQRALPLTGAETSAALLEKLTGLSFGLLDEVLGTHFQSSPQFGPMSYAPKVQKSDARITKDDTVEIADRKVRAFGEEPGAWLDTNTGPLRVIEAVIKSFNQSAADGVGLRLIEVEKTPALWDGTSASVLLLSTVQPFAKKSMPAKDWWRGFRGDLEIY